MHLTRVRFVPALLLMFGFCAAVPAQTAKIESMKLLTPEAGWASTGHTLFWTTDNGRHWKNITPKMSPKKSIDSVFFLDSSAGWALLVGDEAGANEPRFDLAFTGDAGTTWAVTRVKLPHNPGFASVTGGGHIDFIERRHGWLNVPLVSSANFRLGIMLATSNGGRTWSWLPNSPGVSGSVRFANLNNGWLAGGPGDEHLFVTHDGSRSWMEVTMKAPADAGNAVQPAYTQPPFFRQ